MKHKSQQPFNAGEISDQYKNCKDNYNKLGINLVQALELFLKERDIKVLSIDYRVKADSSFAEKIDRKHYANPFDEIEDICGIRIICYYQSDVEKISEVLREEFTVIENQDKETLLKADQFGYRSTHFIVKIKEEWNKAPNYRGLENLKAEIQIRTVLMHAWAEIEHKLVYKNENQVPSHLRRKLSRISAKLEESDEQFDELRKESASYKEEVTEKFEKDEYEGVELNVDSLQAFLDKHFSDRYKNTDASLMLNNDLIYNNVSLMTLYNAFKKIKSFIFLIERDWFDLFKEEVKALTNRADVQKMGQAGIVAIIMQIIDDNYTSLIPTPYKKHTELIEKWRKIIAADEAAKNAKET